MGITFSDVGFSWPNGEELFNHLSFSLQQNRYGLIGVNGIGKSTIVKLITGELIPTAGRIESDFSVEVFTQSESRTDQSVLEYFDDVAVFENHHALEFLEGIPLEASSVELSGGQWSRVRLAKLMAQASDFVIMDEPTNHLDRLSRNILFEFLKKYSGGVLLISHDRELLSYVNEILELTNQGISVYGGNFDHYLELRNVERDKLEKNLEAAKKNRDLHEEKAKELLERQDKRMRRGEKKAREGGIPRILLGGRKNTAQKSQGSLRKGTSQKLNDLVQEASLQYEKVKRDPVMYADLAEVKIPQGKVILRASELNFRYENSEENVFGNNLNFAFQGKARIAIKGQNGSGKTTLINLLTKQGMKGNLTGELYLGNLSWAYVDQEYLNLRLNENIFDNVRKMSSKSDVELRNILSMFLFRGEKVFQKCDSLSGGEKLRLSLALAMSRDLPAELLILDEPTNNLDLANIEFLEDVLVQYQGAIIAVSHDEVFLENIGVTEFISL